LCKRRHAYYTAQRAHNLYLSTLSESRSGVRAGPEKLREIDELIKPLLLRGQSLNHIFATHAEKLGCSRKTIYNYIDNRALSTMGIDLPRKPRYRKRKKPKPAYKHEYAYRHGRMISDYQSYLELNPDVPVIEMDTVVGKRTKGKALLTMVFKDSGFMLIFLMPDQTHKSVLKIFDDLTGKLGLNEFRRLFPVILTDNGVEFKNATALEYTSRNDQRTRMFYCDPQAAWQKPHIERNHQFIRYVIPRFTSFDPFSQEDMTLLSNHINSFCRDRLDGKSPFDIAEKHMKELLEVLGLARVAPDDVLLKPALLKR
jgi:IS30 family transposase